MGWRPEEGYYQKHVKEEGYTNKITSAQEAFNKLEPSEVAKGINVVSEKIIKEQSKKMGKEVKAIMKEQDDEMEL